MALFPRKKIEIKPEDTVRLKPFLGIKPAQYTAALFALSVCVVLFVLLFLPGIVRSGSSVCFRSEPQGAAVFVDGVYCGQTPSRLFVEKGSREISMVMEGFEDEVSSMAVKSRLFASLFAPRRAEFSLALHETAPNAALLAAAKEFAAWSFTGEPTESYQIPLVLSEGAYRSGGGGDADISEDILIAALRFVRTSAAIKDFSRAFLIAGSGGKSPSPLSFAASAQEAAAFLKNEPDCAALLAASLKGNALSVVRSSKWYEKAIAPRGKEAHAFVDVEALTIGGLGFVPVTKDLYAAREPVSLEQFARFTESAPLWSADNILSLASQGLAVADYLRQIDDSRFPANAAGGISWFAAKAYCDWLSTRLPARMSGWIATLPTETDWEALSAKVEGAGRAWEWCASPYAPFPSIGKHSARSVNIDNIIEEIASPEKTVWGTNWANPKPAARGSAPPESSTPFITFRPVLVRARQ